MTTSSSQQRPMVWTPAEPGRAEQTEAADFRVDSPLDTRHAQPLSKQQVVPTLQRNDSHGHPQSGYATDSRGSISERQQHAMLSNGATKRKDSFASVKFIFVKHPGEPKDPDELREKRQHVMHYYLDNERHNPASTDTRVNGRATSRKRKRQDSVPARTSCNPAAAANIFRQAPARLTPATSDYSNSSSDDQSARNVRAVVPSAAFVQERAKRQLLAAESCYSIPSNTTGKIMGKMPLVSGISGRFNNDSYLSASPDQIPFPLSYLGSSLNPFCTWPTFSDSSIDVSRLKWSCSRRFGSKAMGRHWVPVLLQGRHTFLSTICISSAHDDIMSRAAQPPDSRYKHESVERMRVRQEVTSMINEAMQDQHLQTTDATLMAVLQLLNSEIMGCDDGIMRVHQKGLHAMIQLRGGLAALGVSGQLAAITTCTEYMIAALRETMPHADFVSFALSQNTSIPRDGRLIPESPLFCREAGYVTLKRIISPESNIGRLLDEGRRLTNAFVTCHGKNTRVSKISQQGNSMDRESDRVLQRAANEIFAMQPGTNLKFRSTREQYTYEAIRLTSRLYAHALARRIAFSEAAAQLSSTESDGSQASSTALHVKIHRALMRTDITDCWGHMSGVLFWIALVAGASANPMAPSYRDGFANAAATEEGEEARKWLAAITIRCSIVLGFEFGSSIMETLKRMIGIQQVLGHVAMPEQAEAAGFVEVPRRYGPGLPPRGDDVQRGFADFAYDFLTA